MYFYLLHREGGGGGERRWRKGEEEGGIDPASHLTDVMKSQCYCMVGGNAKLINRLYGRPCGHSGAQLLPKQRQTNKQISSEMSSSPRRQHTDGAAGNRFAWTVCLSGGGVREIRSAPRRTWFCHAAAPRTGSGWFDVLLLDVCVCVCVCVCVWSVCVLSAAGGSTGSQWLSLSAGDKLEEDILGSDTNDSGVFFVLLS